MGKREYPGPPAPSAAVVGAGLEHVRLSYHYLDASDLDGLASLLDNDVLVRSPGRQPVHGRHRAGELCTGHPDGRPGSHAVHDIFGTDTRIVATGRYFPRPEAGGPVNIEFADFFTITESGLLATKTTYYFADPF